MGGGWETCLKGDQIPFFGPAAAEAVNSVKVDQVVIPVKVEKLSYTISGMNSAPQ